MSTTAAVLRNSGWFIALAVVALPSVYSIVLHSLALIGLVSIATSPQTQLAAHMVYDKAFNFMVDMFPQLKSKFPTILLDQPQQHHPTIQMANNKSDAMEVTLNRSLSVSATLPE